ncbi:alpha/beta hydrolase [Actinoalloteichus sp. AHMU CJ021]|uniref:Pimeloyl-ACP methyl ester carboxylesterase n=1 Tax=Actinoalloteichus caeruleus DSM 43889 TaxID=1120930 RepID=A0ABT1JIA8_ACTCY|nr:alpha/beta fold hydrolase [Actinoalloteichus caeruleus]AUS78206.1 alpha/beta hydrolase [Actinoalloteichus sp. AHMU CJ021]MCP2332245.1 Pimeloyl-ACP methyl ester carboxylesterase [Actinoalloteichus caeruleus DSM 43889]
MTVPTWGALSARVRSQFTAAWAQLGRWQGDRHREATAGRVDGRRPDPRRSLTWVPMFTGEVPAIDHRRPPWPGRQVEVGRGRVHVRETPSTSTEEAAPVVCVHGLAGSATNWTDLAGVLAVRHPTLAVDLPGFGRSEPPAHFGYGLDEHADFLAESLRRLAGGPAHLVGNSFGGLVCAEVAARWPELVSTLTLVSPAVPDLRPNPGRLTEPRYPLTFLPLLGPRVRRALARVPPARRAEQLRRLCFARPELVPTHRLAELADELAELGRNPWAGVAMGETSLNMVRSWLASGARSPWRVLRRVPAPALVVWGAEDRLVSVRKATRTALALPRARLLVLPRTGHVAQMEQPMAVGRAVLGMIDALAEDQWEPDGGNSPTSTADTRVGGNVLGA